VSQKQGKRDKARNECKKTVVQHEARELRAERRKKIKLKKRLAEGAKHETQKKAT